MPPQKRGAKAGKGAASDRKKAPPAPTKMDIGPKIDTYPELEEKCLELLQGQYEDLMGAPPLPEIIDYVMTIGVRSDSSRAVVFENFHVLFKEKTEVLVKYLFDTLQPKIQQCFENLQSGKPIDQADEDDDAGDFEDGDAQNQKHGGKQKSHGNDKQKQSGRGNERDSRGGQNNASSSRGGRDQGNQRDNRDGGRDGGRDSGRDGGVKQGRDDKFQSKGGDRPRTDQSKDRNDRNAPRGATPGQGQGQQEQKSFGGGASDPKDCKCKQFKGGKYGKNPPCFTCATGSKQAGGSSRGGGDSRDQAGAKRGRGESEIDQDLDTLIKRDAKHGDSKRQNRGDGAPGEDPPHRDQNAGGYQSHQNNSYQQQDDGYSQRKPSFDQGGRGGRGGYDQGGRGGGRGGYDQGGRGGGFGQDRGGRGGGFGQDRGGRGGYDQGGRGGGRGGYDQGGRGGGRGGFEPRGRGGFDGGRGGGRGGYEPRGRGGFDGGRGRGGFDGGRGRGGGGYDQGGRGRGGYDQGGRGGRGGYDQGGRGGYGGHDGGFVQRGRGGFDGGRGRGGYDQGGRGRGGYDQGGRGRGGYDQGGYGRGGHDQYGNHQQNERYPGHGGEDEAKQKRVERFGALFDDDDTGTDAKATGKPEGLDLQRQRSKKNVRCRHWPNCKDEATCEFHHPSEPCKFFPKCTRGDTCIYIHPDIACKFEDSCTRMNCSYKHSAAQGQKRQQMMMMNPLMMMMSAMNGGQGRGGFGKPSSMFGAAEENGRTVKGEEKPTQASVAKSDSAPANTTTAPDSAQLPAKTETQTQNLEQPVQQQMVSAGPMEEGEC